MQDLKFAETYRVFRSVGFGDEGIGKVIDENHYGIVKKALEEQPLGFFDRVAANRVPVTKYQAALLVEECRNFNGFLGYLWALESLARQIGAKFVAELGRFHGLSLLFMSRTPCVEKVVSVDIVPERFSAAVSNDEDVKKKAILIDGDSRKPQCPMSSLEALRSRGVKVDKEYIELLFVDSNHDRPTIEAELRNWIPFCKQNCVFVFHDIGSHPDPQRCMYPDVRQWWNDTIDALGESSSWFDLACAIAPYGLGLGIIFGKSGLEQIYKEDTADHA